MIPQELARKVRRHVVEMANRARSSHVGSSLGMVDLLAVLYTKVLKYDVEQPKAEHRDRLILSKGHAASGLYATLAEVGFFPVEELLTFYGDNSYFAGHVNHNIPGIEASTGSLGHGLGIGCGMAYVGLNRNDADQPNYRVFVVMSDGECDEGSIWEAALLAPAWKLNNLTVIIDYNKIQSLGFVKDILDLEPFADKWKSFGWEVVEVDGHDIPALEEVLGNSFQDKPRCVIAHTVKGKGVSFMENQVIWHYHSPTPDEFAIAMKELS